MIISIKKVIILKISIFLLFSANCQNWENVSPFIEANDKLDGCFINAQKGWIKRTSSGEAYKLYFTNDSAKTFDCIYNRDNPKDYIYNLQMIDSLYGWISFRHNDSIDSDSLLFTSDGGFTWENLTDTTIFGYNDLPLNAESKFYFLDSVTGFINGYDIDEQKSYIYKTYDGGKQWHKTYTQLPEDNDNLYGDYFKINKYYFLNDSIGWAAGYRGMLSSYGILLYTKDSGENWSVLFGPGIAEIFDFSFLNSKKGIFVTRSSHLSQVYITIDNYTSILHQYILWSHDMDHFAEACGIQNDSVIWITGFPGKIYYSDNCGESFDLYQTVGEGSLGLCKFQFFDEVGYIFGDRNSLLKIEKSIENDIPSFQYKTGNGFDCQIFPNPSRGLINVSYESKSNNSEIFIYTSNGILIEHLYEKNIKNGYRNLRIHIEHKGIYLVKILDKDQSITKRLIII